MQVFELFAKIALDSKEFDSGIKGAKGGAESLGKTLGQSQGGADAFGKALKQVGLDCNDAKGKLDLLAQECKDAEDEVKRLSEAYEKSAKESGESSKKTQELGEKLAAAKEKSAALASKFETTNNKLAALRAKADEAGRNVKELAEAFNKSAKESGAASKETQELAEKLKAAEKEADALGRELDEYEAEAKGAASATDKLGDSMDNAKSKMSGIASGLGKAAGKVALAGMGAAATGIGAIVKQSVDAYGEYEQLVGGMDTLFKGSAGTMVDYANSAYATAQVSANEYMDLATSFAASMINSLDGDVSTAAEVTNMAVHDMADNWNKMGTSAEDVMNAYKGFSKQNFTMLDNLKLGYGGTKEEMQKLLDKAEELNKAKGLDIEYDMDNFADVVDAIHVVQEEMGMVGVSAAEAKDTVQGSLAMMKASWKNLLVSLGKGNSDIRKDIDNLLSSASAFAKNVLPVVRRAIEGVAQLIGELAPKIAEKLPEVISEILPPLLEAAGTLVAAIGDAIIDNLPVLVDAAVQLIDSFAKFIDENSEGLAEAARTITSALVELIRKLVPTLLPLLLELGGQIVLGIGQGIADSFAEDPGGTIAAVALFATMIGSKLSGGLLPFINDVKDMITGIGDLAKTVGNGFPSSFGGAGKAAAGAAGAGKGIGGFLGQNVGAATSTVGGALGTVGAVAGVGLGAFGITSAILEATGADDALAEWSGKMYDKMHSAEIAAGVASDKALQHATEAIQGTYPVKDALAELDAAIVNASDIEAEQFQKLRDVMAQKLGDMVGVSSEAAQAFDNAASATRSMSDEIEASGGGLPETIGGFFSELPETIGGFFESLPETIGGFFAGIGEKAQEVVADIGTWFSELPGRISEGLASVAEGAAQFMAELPEKAAEAGFAIGEAVGGIIASIVEFATVTVPQAAEAIGTFFSELPGRVAEWLSGIIASIGEWFASVGEFLSTNISMLIENAGTFMAELLGRIAEWLSGAMERFAEWGSQLAEWASTAIPQFVESVATFFSELPGRVAEWLSNTVQKAVEFGTDLGQKAMDAGRQFLDNLMEAVRDIPSKMLQVGKDIVNGVWNGIQSMASTFTASVKGFFGGIVDGAKSTLGIRSPSKVFAGIGKNMALGLEEGWDGGMSPARKLIEGSLDFSGLSPEIAVPDVGAPKLSGIPAAPAQGGLGGGRGAEEPRQINVILELDRAEFARAVYKYNRQETQRVGVSLAGGIA